MRNIATMAQRELGAYFLSPIAYAVAAVFLFSAGLAFGLGTFRNGEESSMRSLLEWVMLILVLVLPFLTMRLLSEEFRSGTIESLMTLPITEVEIVLGKYLGALAFYVILLVALLVYPIILSMYGPVDVELLAANYIGLLLLGALYIAVGLFFSTCTKHQIITVLLSVGLLVLLTLAAFYLAQNFDGWPRVVLQQLCIRTHFVDFVRGVLDVSHVVFFLTMTGLFLFLAVKLLEVRRWQ